MDDPTKPKEEGTRYLGPPVDMMGVVEKHPLQVGNAESLSVMQEEYAFFTPAVLYLHARFTDGPLIDAMWEMRETIKIYHKKFDRPIFRGLETRDGNKDWNHVLWAVERPYWQFLHNFIASLTLSNADTKTIIRVGGQDIQVYDPLAADRAKIVTVDLPTLVITAYGINGNKHMAGLVPGLTPLAPPVLRFFPPQEDIRVFAEAYYAGKNPLNERSNYLNAQKLKEEKHEGPA